MIGEKMTLKVIHDEEKSINIEDIKYERKSSGNSSKNPFTTASNCDKSPIQSPIQYRLTPKGE